MTSPFAPILFLILAAIETFVLIWPLARPNSIAPMVIWAIALLLVSTAILVRLVFPGESGPWTPPAWHTALVATILLVPFVISALLWWFRRKPNPRLGMAVSTVILIAAIVLPWLAYRSFNESCIYFDYYHDTGTAWCPQDWQAKPVWSV